jgi:hypothetical protein
VLDNDTIESPVSLALSTGVHVYTHARTHAPFLICIYIYSIYTRLNDCAVGALISEFLSLLVD